jgi:cytochrome c oxidase subunit 2
MSFPRRPLDVSLDGFRSDVNFDFITAAIAILFSVIVLVLLWVVLFRRARPGRTALYERGMARRHLVLIGALAALFFFGIDGVVLYRGYADLQEGFFKFPTAAERPIEVEVIGQQWSFQFRLPGADGLFNTPDDLLTLDELHVPVGRPIALKMRAKDVIHSLYLPNFRIKQDLIPGTTTRMWFQATQMGTYEFGCAQFCGVSHYKMHGTLQVESPEGFARWLAVEGSAARDRYDPEDREAHWGWTWEEQENR